ncbi:MAG: hypothetical protein Q4B96_07735 [Bacillota bacterium]|nr:hypothetical protein [Bacillota bacterium]
MAALNLPIQMISVCDADGRISPLRFRLADETVVRIGEVLAAKEQNYAGAHCFSYICRAVSGGRELLFELRYAVRSHQWTLYRIIN